MESIHDMRNFIMKKKEEVEKEHVEKEHVETKEIGQVNDTF